MITWGASDIKTGTKQFLKDAIDEALTPHFLWVKGEDKNVQDDENQENNDTQNPKNSSPKGKPLYKTNTSKLIYCKYWNNNCKVCGRKIYLCNYCVKLNFIREQQSPRISTGEAGYVCSTIGQVHTFYARVAYIIFCTIVRRVACFFNRLRTVVHKIICLRPVNSGGQSAQPWTSTKGGKYNGKGFLQK